MMDEDGISRVLSAPTKVGSANQRISLRCPRCRKRGTFDTLSEYDMRVVHDGRITFFGQRMCPDLKCRAHVFVAWDENTEVIASYPPELIDFDPDDIPKEIVDSFKEALVCRANNAYRAAAMMVRRTLEELCADKNAKGKNLKARLEALRANVVLPPRLLDALDHLRLLGNDAAHIEARDYANVGADEVDIGITVTKEILKSTYQMDSLVSRLEALQTNATAGATS